MNITIPATQCNIYNFTPTWVFITGLVVGFIVGVAFVIIMTVRFER